MTRIAFSVAAQDDRRAITACTAEDPSSRRPRVKFERVLNTLANTPMVGRPCHEQDLSGRTYRYFVMMRLFAIVYELTSTGIRGGPHAPRDAPPRRRA